MPRAAYITAQVGVSDGGPPLRDSVSRSRARMCRPIAGCSGYSASRHERHGRSHIVAVLDVGHPRAAARPRGRSSRAPLNRAPVTLNLFGRMLSAYEPANCARSSDG